MANNKSEVRVIKRINAHSGHHGGAWKVAYADFVTAMMAFFLVMWIVGLSQDVKQAIAGYFKDPAAFMQAVKSGNAPFKVTEIESGTGKGKSPPSPSNEAAEREKLQEAQKTLEKIVSASPEFKDLKNHIDIQMVDEGLRVDLVEDKESLFFDSASAKIKPMTKQLLARITMELARLPNQVIIEGHTDSLPLNRTDGYTNWELSADRANSARQVMEQSGLKDTRVAQVRGYAATQPRDAEHPEHFSNRRVSIIVVMNGAMKRQQFSLTDISKKEWR